MGIRANVITSVEYERVLDLRTGDMVPRRAIQTVYVDGLSTGVGAKAVEQAKAAALAAEGGHGDPNVQNMEIGSVRAKMLDGGTAAIVYITWINTDVDTTFQGGKPPVVAWSNDFKMQVRRFLREDGASLAVQGEKPMRNPNGTPVFFDFDVPCSHIFRIEYTSTKPSNFMAGVGGFTTIGAVTDAVRILPPDFVEIGTPGHYTYEIKRAYEWREKALNVGGSVNINGWTVHLVDKDDKIKAIKPSGAPGGLT